MYECIRMNVYFDAIYYTKNVFDVSFWYFPSSVSVWCFCQRTATTTTTKTTKKLKKLNVPYLTRSACKCASQVFVCVSLSPSLVGSRLYCTKFSFFDDDVSSIVIVQCITTRCVALLLFVACKQTLTYTNILFLLLLLFHTRKFTVSVCACVMLFWNAR